MADVMTFPKTMKEFVDNYSFKDSDEVYTNGSMLIPTFRVEQAIEHYEQEIRNKAIDEFLKQVNRLCFGFKASQGNLVRVDVVQNALNQIAEQTKGGE